MVKWTSVPLLYNSKPSPASSLHSSLQTMSDHRVELAGNYPISSHSSAHQVHTRHEGEGGREFSFWNSSNTMSSYTDCDKLGGNEAWHNREAVFGEKSKTKNLKVEYSPFLSDPSRSKAVEEGRKELMEMMQGMPESSFELSFQDMVVDEKQMLQPHPHQDETCVNNELMQSSGSSSKALIKKPNKTKKSKSSRPGQIMRVESMDSESFLLKLFFPTSLKKMKVENGSKVSPKPSLQESVKQLGKDWSIKSSSSNDKSRYFDRNISFTHGCWPFNHYTKGMKKKVGG